MEISESTLVGLKGEFLATTAAGPHGLQGKRQVITEVNNQNPITAALEQRMPKNGHMPKYRSGERIPSEVDLRLAQLAVDAKSMSFTIPATTGSLESELHTLREQLQYLHTHHITARALMPIVKVDRGPNAVVQNSGLVLWIAIGNMPPEVLACVRIKCQRAMRQIARDKGLCRDYGSEQYTLSNTAGFLGRGHVASQVQTFTKNIREYFRTGKNPTNGVIQYRISKSGAFESAEVDFRQPPIRIKFTEATIPER